MSDNRSLDELRKSLKKWEAAFVIVHQRKPSKEDVANAPPDIKEKYKLYHEAKKGSAENRVQSVRRDDPSTAENVEVWGPELNKKHQQKNSAGSQEGQRKSEGSQTVLDEMGSKLFQNIALSQSYRNAITKSKKFKGVFKDPSADEDKAERMKHSSAHPDVSAPDKFWGKSPGVHETRPTAGNYVGGESEQLDSNISAEDTPAADGRRSEQLDSNISAEDTPAADGRRSEQLDSNISAEDTPAADDSDLVVKGEIFKGVGKFLSKKTSNCSSLTNKRLAASSRSRSSFLSRDFTHVKASGSVGGGDEADAMTGGGQLDNYENSGDGLGNNSIPPGVLQASPDSEAMPDEKGGDSSQLKTESPGQSLLNSAPSSATLKRENLRKTKAASKLSPPLGPILCQSSVTKEASSHETKHLSLSSDVFNFEKEYAVEKSVSASAKKGPSVNMKQLDVDESEAALPRAQSIGKGLSAGSPSLHRRQGQMSGPGSSKKRKLQVLQGDGNGSDDSLMPQDENHEEKDISECQAKTAAEKPAAPKKAAVTKRSAASLNENYVCLNMKKKGYRRKGAGLTGAQLRKKQWKAKMSARSQSYGANKCFKCGQEGHWANKCKGKATRAPDVNAPGPGSLDAAASGPVEESDFPSLRQAALMARGTGRGNTEAEAEVDDGDITDIEASIVRDRWEDSAASSSQQAPSAVQPLTSTLDDVETEVEQGLRVFGFSDFRPGQRDSVMRILSGLSTLVVLSTGAGKSLCYQLPAYLYGKHAGAITLVISPLVSLMEDQIDGLPAGVRGACLHSNMTQTQRDAVVCALKEGKVHFLLVSPEALVEGGGAQSSFPPPDQLPPIAFACIDEAHCLSEWSHNFRPSYLRLCKVLRSLYGVTCFLGLTATATRATARDVARHLGMGDDDAATVRGAAVPRNLVLSASRDENKDEALLNLLKGPRFSACHSIIIYCSRREQTNRVATLIRTSLQTCADLSGTPGVPPPAKKARRSKKSSAAPADFDPGVWTAESYHAGLRAAKRKSVQKAFMSGRLRVVAATVAFGMGLDKADVRAVIHYSMAKSFESYVQEIGRAGRDGGSAHCHVFLDPQNRDLSELRRHTFGNSVDRSTLKKLVSAVFSPCRCAEISSRSGQLPRKTSPVEETVAGDEEGEEVEKEVSRTDKDAQGCPGHERAVSIQDIVQRLDVKEEGVATLLCYLELRYPTWLEMFNHVYCHCAIRCYGGPAQLQATAKKCPPVAVAIARQKLEGKSFSNSSELEFKVVDVCDAMGWDSRLVKRELRALQWTSGPSGFRKSGVLVEFSDLAFHFRSRGDLTDDLMDEVLDFLTSRTGQQERTELSQLEMLSDVLQRVSHKNYWMCSEEADLARSDKLKNDLEAFFDRERKDGEDDGDDDKVCVTEPDGSTLSQLHSDIRQFISLYGQDHALSGRSIARVFHGIGSPNFPVDTWGRVRRFWRSHLHVDFPIIVREGTRMVVAMR